MHIIWHSNVYTTLNIYIYFFSQTTIGVCSFLFSFALLIQMCCCCVTTTSHGCSTLIDRRLCADCLWAQAIIVRVSVVCVCVFGCMCLAVRTCVCICWGVLLHAKSGEVRTNRRVAVRRNYKNRSELHSYTSEETPKASQSLSSWLGCVHRCRRSTSHCYKVDVC